MFNPDSPKQLEVLLFGGVLKKATTEAILASDGRPEVIKSGKNKGNIKFHKVTRDIEIKGLGLTPTVFTPSGGRSTDKEALAKLDHPIPRLILETRKRKKQISTYYDNTEAVVYEMDQSVHPTISHCGYGDFGESHGGTNTGRLSSANPNAQNQPKPEESNVRHHFVSRYEGGTLISADFSQLEIVVQAQLSQDKKYIQDVVDGIDFHSKRLAMKEQIPYDQVIKSIKINKDEVWINKRSKIKQFSFQRTYGAGANHISQKTGIDVEDIKQLIKNEEIEYPTLLAYNKRLEDIVEATSKGTDEGSYQSPTGRQYFFKKYPSPEWMQARGIMMSFRPPQIKNYIVQGTGWDVVSILLGLFWRQAIRHRDKFVLIMTVHDDIICDVRPGYEEFTCNLLKDVLSYKNVVKYFQTNFNYTWTVPVEISIKTGKTWGQLE